MERSKWFSLAVAVIVTSGLLFAPLSADAAFVLTLDEGNNGIDVTVTDGGAGDLNALAGAITFSGGLGSWVVNVTTGLSKPLIGPGGSPALDLNSVDVTGGTGGLLVIRLTDTDYFAGDGPISWETSIGGTTNGSVTASAWVNPENDEFGTGAANIVFGPAVFGPVAFAASSAGLTQPLDGPFSSTIEIVINHTGGNQVTSFDIVTNAVVPEPATVALLGGALVGLCAAARRRM